MFTFRISKSIRSQLTEELNGTQSVPPNPVSMYLYAKSISDASYSITKIINNLKADRHLKGKDIQKRRLFVLSIALVNFSTFFSTNLQQSLKILI